MCYFLIHLIYCNKSNYPYTAMIKYGIRSIFPYFRIYLKNGLPHYPTLKCERPREHLDRTLPGSVRTRRSFIGAGIFFFFGGSICRYCLTLEPFTRVSSQLPCRSLSWRDPFFADNLQKAVALCLWMDADLGVWWGMEDTGVHLHYYFSCFSFPLILRSQDHHKMVVNARGVTVSRS